MNQIGWLLLAFGLAVVLDLYIIRAWRRYRQLKQEHDKSDKPISRWVLWKRVIISQKMRRIFRAIWNRIWTNQRLNWSFQAAIELGLIAIWSIYVGGRWYFTDSFAAMLELGYGIAWLNIGVAFKF